MLSLQIDNPEIETIFLEGFNSNKESFFAFIQENYQKMLQLNSLERSIAQAKLQESGELEESTLDELIDELENSTHA
jgi:NAD-dependent SIR2 family protein deacetylase